MTIIDDNVDTKMTSNNFTKPWINTKIKGISEEKEEAVFKNEKVHV